MSVNANISQLQKAKTEAETFLAQVSQELVGFYLHLVPELRDTLHATIEEVHSAVEERLTGLRNSLLHQRSLLSEDLILAHSPHQAMALQQMQLRPQKISLILSQIKEIEEVNRKVKLNENVARAHAAIQAAKKVPLLNKLAEAAPSLAYNPPLTIIADFITAVPKEYKKI